jgi:phage gp29-like protein
MAESRILDPRTGEPFRLADIQGEPQTARVGSLHQEFANHPTRGLTPPRLAQILQAAEQGDMLAQCDLFDDMEEKDAHIFAEMQKRKLALLGLDWDIVPPRNASAAEVKAADTLRDMLQDLDIEDVITDAASAIGHGYSCMEMAWQREGKEWLPEIHFRPHRWFTVDVETRTQLRLRTLDSMGESLQPFGWIVHRHQAKSGYLTRGGLHRVLAWPFLFKNYSVRDLAEFLEIYGLPLRVGTYPVGATDAEKATLLRAVVNIGHAAAGIVPEGMTIEFKEAAKGASDPFMAMIQWAEASQSKAILGGTLTSGSGDGTNTNALGNVHNEVRHDLLVADARQIAATLTRDLVYPLAVLNLGGIDNLRRCPRFKFETDEEEDMNTRAERDEKIYAMGFEPTEEYIQETYGEGWEKKKPVESTTTLRGMAALKGQPDELAPAELTAQQLATQAQPAVADWLAQIEAMLEAAGSLEEFRAMLLAAFDELPGEQFAAAMSAGMEASGAAAWYDVEAQAGD